MTTRQKLILCLLGLLSVYFYPIAVELSVSCLLCVAFLCTVQFASNLLT